MAYGKYLEWMQIRKFQLKRYISITDSKRGTVCKENV